MNECCQGNYVQSVNIKTYINHVEEGKPTTDIRIISLYIKDISVIWVDKSD